MRLMRTDALDQKILVDVGTNKKMKALITGITGRDGSYFAEFLLAKGYEVYGIIRRSRSFNPAQHRIDRDLEAR